jgi:hypothetical protein
MELVSSLRLFVYFMHIMQRTYRLVLSMLVTTECLLEEVAWHTFQNVCRSLRIL